MKHDYNSLKEKVLQGMLTLILRDFGLKVISVIGQLILVRLVAPEYFGIFAIISFVVNIFELISDLGFSQAIVQQKKELTRIQISTIFFIKLFLGSIAFFLLVISFPVINFFYHQLTTEHFIVMLVVGTTIFTKTIKGLSFALFDRNLNFNVISKIEIFGIVSYFIVAIFFAFKKIYLLNFVYAIITKELIEFLLAYYYKPWRPHFEFDINSVKQMIRYGSFLQLGNIVAFIERSIVPIVGFRLSSNNLGLLDWSLNVTRLSNTLFESYGRVAFAGMAKIQDKKEKISNAVNKSITMLNIFAFLFIIIILGFSKEAVTLIISDKWVPALPALYWFVSSLLFFGGAISIAHALLAMGKSKEVTFFTGINMIFEVVIAFFMMRYVGFYGIAIAVFIGNFTQLIGYIFLGKKSGLILELKKTFLSKSLLLIPLAIIIIVLNVFFVKFSFVTLIVKITITITLYISLLFLYLKDDVKEILGMLTNFHAHSSFFARKNIDQQNKY